MTPRLAILAPRIGAPSETFIARHINELLAPRDTLVMTREVVPSPTWSARPETITVEHRRRYIPYGSRRWQLATSARRILPRTGPRPPSRSWLTAMRGVLSSNPSIAVLAEYVDVWAPLLLEARLGGESRVVSRALGYDISQRTRDARWIEVYKRLADVALIAPCSRYSVRVLAELGVPTERLVYIPNSVNVIDFVPRLDANTTSFLSVLSVGRLVEKKDPRPTILAASALRRSGIQVELILAGDGPLREKCRDEAEACGMTAHTRFLGAVSHSQVRSLYRSADIFVQHSQTAMNGDEEGMPLSILEAMAAALPVVSTRHAGITEVLAQGGGLLVEPGDVDGLRSALLHLASDPVLRASLGRSGRELVSDQYSWSTERDALLRVLGLEPGAR